MIVINKLSTHIKIEFLLKPIDWLDKKVIDVSEWATDPESTQRTKVWSSKEKSDTFKV